MISPTLLDGHFGEDGEDNPSWWGGWRGTGGSGECHSDQRLIGPLGKMGKIGTIIPTRAREHVSTGCGVMENLLTRRFKISSLSSPSSLKNYQPIENARKDQRSAEQVIIPVGEVIFPNFPKPFMGGAGCWALMINGHNILRRVA